MDVNFFELVLQERREQRDYCAGLLETMPTEGLKRVLGLIFEDYRGRTIDQNILACTDPKDDSNSPYWGLGAFDVISAREGKDFALGLFGKRSPKGLIEKITYALVGDLPDAVARQ